MQMVGQADSQDWQIVCMHGRAVLIYLHLYKYSKRAGMLASIQQSPKGSS